MASLTLEMIRKASIHLRLRLPAPQRAEHNDGVLHSLEELSLNQMGLVDLGSVDGKGRERDRERRRSLLPRACRRLRHLSLAGNALPRLPCGPRGLGLLKELRTLNASLNAIETIRFGEGGGTEGGPLSSLESLERLDLSGNFISVATARETALSLASAPALESLWLAGCPVAVEWEEGHRSFFVASLPRLKELDGVAITAVERIEALEKLPGLQRELLEAEKEQKKDGGETDDDASSVSSSAAELAELEAEADSLEKEMRAKGDDAPMPWSRAARLVLARETAAAAAEKDKTNKAAAGKGTDDETTPSSLFDGSSRVVQPLRTSMPPWSSSDDDGSSGDDDEGERRRRRRQRDEGAWPFALFPCRDGCSPHLVLEVALGTRVAPSDVELDVRRRHVRLLASGSLLCARLPAAIVPSRATARRSLASGKLVVEMPLEDPESEIDESCVREWKKRGERAGEEETTTKARAFAAAARVAVAASDESDDEDDDALSPPPL